jgi:hypothetical protein
MNFLKKLFYFGPRCSRCSEPLQSAQGLSMQERLTSNMDSAYKCNKCGTLTCGSCYEVGFGLPQPCPNCRGSNFTVFTVLKG